MKKVLASLVSLCTSLVLLTPGALALGEESLIVGSQRTFAYWVLGLCSVAFVALVIIWSWSLRVSVKSQPDRQHAYIVSQRQK